MIKAIRTVSIARGVDGLWERVVEVTSDDDSVHLGMHLIPDSAFIGYAEYYGIDDPQVILDMVLLAPYVEGLTPDNLQQVKNKFTSKTKTVASSLLAAIPSKYQPTEEDPHSVLIEAATKGVKNVRKVQQARVLAADGGGRGRGRTGPSVGQGDQLEGVVPGPRDVSPGIWRRTSARKQVGH